jgi:uncharacterized protein
MKFTLRIIHWLAIILVILGALNWGMIGFFKIDIITWLFGRPGGRVFFAIVGVAGVWCISLFRQLAGCDLEKPPKK